MSTLLNDEYTESSITKKINQVISDIKSLLYLLSQKGNMLPVDEDYLNNVKYRLEKYRE